MRTHLSSLLLTMLALLVSGLTATPAAAQSNLRIGFLDSERIVDGYTETKTAMETFRRDVDAWNQEAQTRKTELDQIGRELQQQSPMLSDEKRREKEADYQRKSAEYDQYVQSIWGPQGLLVQRNEEILRPIVTRIQEIVGDIAVEDDYDLILDAADGNILYGDPGLDLTQRVLDRLNGEVGTEGEP